MAVFDNGGLIGSDGLDELRPVASSPKESRSEEHGRRLIGKFGIGRLTTDLLAEQVSFGEGVRPCDLGVVSQSVETKPRDRRG